MNAGYSQFIGAEYTIKFIRIVNDAFDISNSTHKSLSKENIFKRPWSTENIGQINIRRAEIIEYIKGLQIRTDNKRIMHIIE